MHVLHSPTIYFPDLLSLSLIASSGVWLLEMHEHYQKNDLRNRCYIRSKNGLQILSIPIEKASRHNCPITKVSISYHEAWPRKHWQAIQTAYGSAPYFEHYAPPLQKIYASPTHNLWEFNEQILAFLMPILLPGIRKQTTDQYDKPVGISLWDRRTYDIRHSFYGQAENLMRDFVQLPGYKEAYTSKLCALDLLFFLGPHGRLWLQQSGETILHNMSLTRE